MQSHSFCQGATSQDIESVKQSTKSSVRKRPARTSNQSRSEQHAPLTSFRAMQLTESRHHPLIQRCGQPTVPVDGAWLSQPTDLTGAIDGGRQTKRSVLEFQTSYPFPRTKETASRSTKSPSGKGTVHPNPPTQTGAIDGGSTLLSVPLGTRRQARTSSPMR